MKRITVTYGGVDYTVGNASLDEIKRTITDAYELRAPVWLTVNHGEGTFRETEILLSPGISIAVSGIEADEASRP